MDNKMDISTTYKILKAQISAFRVAAHMETTVHKQKIAQHITVDLRCMVLVRSSVHTPFKDLGSHHRHGLQSKIISSVSFAPLLSS